MLGLGAMGSAEASAELGIAVGAFQESDGDIGVRFAIEGSIEGDTNLPIGELTGLFDPPEGSLEGAQAVEVIFTEDGEPSEMVIEQTYGTGENQTQQTIRVDLDSEAMRADAITVRDAITNPTPANIAALTDIDITDWAEGAEYTEASLASAVRTMASPAAPPPSPASSRDLPRSASSTRRSTTTTRETSTDGVGPQAAVRGVVLRHRLRWRRLAHRPSACPVDRRPIGSARAARS